MTEQRLAALESRLLAMKATCDAATPGPWSQGYTIMTRQTRGWTPEQIIKNDRVEGLHLFANFTSEDEGRSRVLVARFERVKDALFIAASRTDYPAFVDCALGLLARYRADVARFADDELPYFDQMRARVTELAHLADALGVAG